MKEMLKNFIENPYAQERFILLLKAIFGDVIEPKEIKIESSFFTSPIKLNKETISLNNDAYALDIYEFHIQNSTIKSKTALHNELKKITNIRQKDIALAVFIDDERPSEFRLSLMTLLYNTSTQKIESSPLKRQSFVLGKDVPTKTAFSQLSDLLDSALSLESLQNAFAIEPVTNEFYAKIQGHYDDFCKAIKLPNSDNNTNKPNFALRLISRILFCKFLEKKGLITSEIWNTKLSSLYYHEVLEPLFFETLNKPIEDRLNLLIDNKKTQISGILQSVPYLNGGLFMPQSNDYYHTQNNINQYINTLKVSNEILDELLDTLNQYHFTIDENSPTEQEIALDPEMLGRVFENLLASITPESSGGISTESSSKAATKSKNTDAKNTLRKSTGSFYTPREIVAYMVKNALLCALNDGATNAEALSKLIFNHDDSAFGEGLNPIKRNLADRILALKVLDPACGSGAFPMGILHEICALLELLDSDCKELKEAIAKDEILGKDEKLSAKTPKYLRKLYTLKNIIYGVDIQPMATEIARLRAFLSLIIDDDKNNITPLPNLEFKFITANSLIPLEKPATDKNGKKVAADLFSNTENIALNELTTIRQKTFTAKDKNALEIEYKEAQKKAFTALISLWSGKTDYVDSKLLSYNPFDSLSVADFFDSNFMFGIESFDIIIGNPPYIRHELMGKDLKEKLSKHSAIFNATSDIYTYFYELGATLAPNGTTCLITSNKYARAGYGRRLRDFLIRQKILSYTELNGLKIFNATVDTSILIFKNTAPKIDHLLKYSRPLNVWEISSNVAQDFKQSDLDAESFIFLDAKSIALKKKIEKIGTPLKKWDISINYGIKTGLNEAFIIDSLTREEILKSCQSKEERERTDKLIRPMLRGKDIKRYRYKWAELYLINTHNGYTDSNGDKIPPIDIEQYPALKAHLDKYKEKLQKREDKGVTPYNLRNCAYLLDFEKPKIVWAELARTGNSFMIDKEKYFPLAGAWLMTSNVGDSRLLHYLCGVLNNPIALFYLEQVYSKLDTTGWQWKKAPIEKIPIPKITESNKHLADEIIKIVERILKSKEQNNPTDELESKIDSLVYQLYNLTTDEINIIES